VEEPYTLADRVTLERERLHGRTADADDASCEDEQECDEYAWYCRGLTLDQLLAVVVTLPEGWTAEVVPVTQQSFADTQITISKQSAFD